MATDSSELPVAIGKVARRELAVFGVTRMDQLRTVTEKELLAIHGVGPKAIQILRQQLMDGGYESKLIQT